MASQRPNPSASLFEGDRNRVEDFASSPPGQNISPRLYRSQSIQDQLNKTPRVNPHWGHSLSRSHGGNDWPLPASPTSSSPTYISTVTPTVAQQAMFTAGLTNEQAFPDTAGPKKRGPKPKNEPAATRRQQLNRIAQRAHRDRKEMYIKNLESEVKRFRLAYSASVAERQKLVNENRLLREEVAAFRAMSGLPMEDVVVNSGPFALPPPQPVSQFSSPVMQTSPPRIQTQIINLESSTSSPKGFSRVFGKLKRKESGSSFRISPPMQTLNEFPTPDSNFVSFPPSPPRGSQSSESPPQTGHGRNPSTATMSTLQSQGLEQPLAQVALNFIVRLEAVCLDHLHAAYQSDQDPESAPHGHALMGSAISITETSPFSSHSHSTASPVSPSTIDSPSGISLDQRTLEVLLNLNFQTNNGEYLSTMGGPIYGSISVLDAWNLVSSDPKFGKFDLDALASRLVAHVTCKGYGPVLDADEVHKAIEEVSSGQPYGRF